MGETPQKWFSIITKRNVILSLGLAFLWPAMDIPTFFKPILDYSIVGFDAISSTYLSILLFSIVLFSICAFAHKKIETLLKNKPSIVVIVSSTTSLAVCLCVLLTSYSTPSLIQLISTALFAAIGMSFLPIAWGYAISFVRIRDASFILLFSFIFSSVIYLCFLPPIPSFIGDSILVVGPFISGLLCKYAIKTESISLEFEKITSSSIKEFPWKTILIVALFILASAIIRGFTFMENVMSSSIFEQVVSLGIGGALIALLISQFSREQKKFEGDEESEVLPWTPLILLFFAGVFSIPIMESNVLGSEFILATLRTFEIFYWILSIKVIRRFNHSPILIFSVARLVFKIIPILVASYLLPAIIGPKMLTTFSIESATLLIAFLLLCMIIVVFNKRTFTEKNSNYGKKGQFEKRCDLHAQRCGLTPRESEIMKLLVKGRSLPRIAEELFLSLGTVQGYSKSIYRKTNVHSKQELIDLIEKEL